MVVIGTAEVRMRGEAGSGGDFLDGERSVVEQAVCLSHLHASDVIPRAHAELGVERVLERSL